MDNSTVVYNEYWTAECIERLKKQQQEADDLYQKLQKIRQMVNPVFSTNLSQIMSEVQELKQSLSLTNSIMENYRCDMERSIAKIAGMIEEAERAGGKMFL